MPENKYSILQQLVAIRRADGGVSIMTFVTSGRGSILPFGAAWLDKPAGWWERAAIPPVVEKEIAAVPGIEVIGWRFIEVGDAPSDRTFRDAWTDDGRNITHDIAKARDIHRAHIRQARSVAFRKLDAQWMKETGQKNTTLADAIEAKRQVWRSAPEDPRIDAAQTVEELKAIPLPAIDDPVADPKEELGDNVNASLAQP